MCTINKTRHAKLHTPHCSHCDREPKWSYTRHSMNLDPDVLVFHNPDPCPISFVIKYWT